LQQEWWAQLHDILDALLPRASLTQAVPNVSNMRD